MWRSEKKRRGFLKTSAAGVSALALILKEAALGGPAVRARRGPQTAIPAGSLGLASAGGDSGEPHQ